MTAASEPPESQRDTIPAPPPTELDHEPPFVPLGNSAAFAPLGSCALGVFVCWHCNGVEKGIAGGHETHCQFFIKGV